MKANIVIAGAGLAGASTAYHLRQNGVDDILVIEKETTPGQHSSGLNAAMVREKVADSNVQVLTSRGANALRTGQFCEFRKTGSLLVGWGDEDVSERFPGATGKALWCPEDGVVDTAGLLQTFLRDQKVLCDCELRQWTPVDGGIAIQTSKGTITTGILVNAAGPWAGTVGDLPLTPMNRHLFQTPQMSEISPDLPIVWDVVNNLYFRPDNGGLLMCVCDQQARTAGDYRVNHNVQIQLAETMSRLQPQLSDLAIKNCWTGQRTFAEDENFVIGFDPRNTRLFHVAGLGGHGVTSSYAVGQLAASLITQRQVEPNPFDPARLVAPVENKRTAI